MLATKNSTRRRSNKPITQFACDHLADFLDHKPIGSAFRVRHDTKVSYSVTKTAQYFNVHHCGHELLTIALDSWQPCSVRISFKNHFNREGMVDITAIERINGLLDTLGSYRAIPDGVRVFRDKENQLCYFGKGDNRVALGPNYASYVLIECNPIYLEVLDHDL